MIASEVVFFYTHICLFHTIMLVLSEDSTELRYQSAYNVWPFRDVAIFERQALYRSPDRSFPPTLHIERTYVIICFG